MPGKSGIFITLEGTDGTGKSTQFSLLHEHLQQAGHKVVVMKFPRYDEPSSYFVREYLAGAYGKADAVNPFAASLFFSLDRYQASFAIRKALTEGKIILCDRFTGSNMIHQGAKFADADKRRGYFEWLDKMEHEILGIPRPDITCVLTAPFDVIQKRLGRKPRSSAHISKDIHEADSGHIRRALDVSLQLCELFPGKFVPVGAVQDGVLLKPEAVHERVWTAVQPRLAPAG